MRACVAALAVVALCSACGGRPTAVDQDAGAEAADGGLDAPEWPPIDVTKLDLLFMLDNSAGNDGWKQSLVQYFPVLVDALAGHQPMPDLHVGIVTSDLGAGLYTPPSCAVVGGDQGLLQNVPRGTSCRHASLIDPADRFLRSTPVADGGVETNFGGSLADAFGCYAAVGTGGCGFEHQLESVRVALRGCNSAAGCSQPVNEGFLRPDAALAVILVTDEDDCSAPRDTRLFDPSQTSVDSQLGPITSYRCFQFGNLCDGVDPGRAPGPRSHCVPGSFDPEPGHQLTPIAEFRDFFEELKPDRRLFYLGVVAAPPEPVVIATDINGYPTQTPPCRSSFEASWPAIRLHHLVGLLPTERARFLPICGAPSFESFLRQIGADLVRMLGPQP